MNRYTDYYLADADGYFLSGLSLLPEEAERYEGLLTVRPPDRPAPVIDREAERIAVAKAYALRSINDQRQQASQANLFFEDIEVQADSASQALLSLKLNEIAAAEAAGTAIPSEALIWRDAHNVIHDFATMTAYKAWITGTVAAISRRATDVYADSWARKALVEASNDYDEILAIASATGGYTL